MKRELYITRMDYHRTHGWWVRFQRFDSKGKRITKSKCFADQKNGGKSKALLAAMAWRDATVPSIPLPNRRQSLPGCSYVRRVVHPTRGNSWMAWLWLEDHDAIRASRSVGRWGERGAKREIVEWLELQRAELRKRMRRQKR